MNPPISPAEIQAFFWACVCAVGIGITILCIAVIVEWRRVGRELDREKQERDLDPPKRDFTNRTPPNWIHQ